MHHIPMRTVSWPLAITKLTRKVPLGLLNHFLVTRENQVVLPQLVVNRSRLVASNQSPLPKMFTHDLFLLCFLRALKLLKSN